MSRKRGQLSSFSSKCDAWQLVTEAVELRGKPAAWTETLLNCGILGAVAAPVALPCEAARGMQFPRCRLLKQRSPSATAPSHSAKSHKIDAEKLAMVYDRCCKPRTGGGP